MTFNRFVLKTRVVINGAEHEVSTVSVLFAPEGCEYETMVWPVGTHDEILRRTYSTQEAAEAGHLAIVASYS
jgi:hypothetical protein